RLEQPPPGRERLLAFGALRAFQADERPSLTREPFAFLLAFDEGSDHRDELLLRRRRVVRLEDPGVRLHDLAERPEAHALAVRERPALAPVDQVGIGLSDLEQLGDEPALADAGDADERHELR